MGIRILFLAAAATLAWSACPGPVAQDFTFEALLERITDLDALTAPVPAGCKHVQFSSYDRASLKGPKDLKAWFANGDCGKFLRVEETPAGKEFVMVDAEGPGVMVRIWSANPVGRLRVYLDNNEKPLLDHPAGDLLDGRVHLFPKPLAGVRARGHNLYVPIPYAKHIKVTCTQGKFYYHVNLLQYPKEIPIMSLTAWDLAQSERLLHKAAAQLREASAPPRAEKWRAFHLRPVRGGPDRLRGEVALGRQISGRMARAVTHFMIKDFEAKDREEALRKILVVMSFDGVETVRVPLSEFFGCGPRAGAWLGLAAGAAKTPEGLVFYNRFPMPYRKSAVVSLENLSGQDVKGKTAWATGPIPQKNADLRFHAVYREGIDLDTRPHSDVNLLDVKGKGRVVGCVLTIRNPVKNWWGEGDEKVFVDGEAFPSIFGTGTEDYFGYAWCCPEIFSHPYHAQPACDGPRNYGITTVNRFHILDPIPFHESVKFDMELWHWKSCKVDYMTTTFFYAEVGAKDRMPFPAGKAPHWKDQGKYVPVRVAGGIEAEEMKYEAESGVVEIQHGSYNWSNDRQVWWKNGMVGTVLSLTFDAPEAGRYRVLARFTRAPDYGRHKITLNDSGDAFEFDFYARRVRLTKELDIGTFDLKKVGNRMRVKCTGRNKKAVNSRMFGLDYLKLEKIGP